jgi:multidrug resistance efflux pump
VAAGEPIMSLGDTSRLAVRMDVDESDLARIRVGDPAYCTAQAFRDRRYSGKVVQLARKLGRKNIETGDPQEKVDTRVLEALIELDGKPELPVGLRMVAFVESRK